MRGFFPPPTYYGSFRGKQAETEELAHTQHLCLQAVNSNQHFGFMSHAMGWVPAALLISAALHLAMPTNYCNFQSPIISTGTKAAVNNMTENLNLKTHPKA